MGCDQLCSEIGTSEDTNAAAAEKGVFRQPCYAHNEDYDKFLAS